MPSAKFILDNPVKLLEKNPLNVLEHIESICDNVGSINVNGLGDLITQFVGILSGNKDK